MGLFSLFKKPDPTSDLRAVFPLLSNAIKESDRTYRGMLQIYNEEGGQANLSGKGLFKARMIGAAYVAFPLLLKWPSNDAFHTQVGNFAGALAADELTTEGSGISFSVDDARQIAPSFWAATIEALARTMKAPRFSSDPAGLLAALGPMIELGHECLSDSIGSEHYTATVRERFTPLWLMNIHANMNMVRDVEQALR